jgi:hypothetical protein
VEKMCIKFWSYYQGNCELIKRIHIKQNIKQCCVAELTGFLLILGENGKILILDGRGEFVSTISYDNTFFTHISTANDKLLLGTESGTIQVFHAASLSFVSEIPYQMALVKLPLLNKVKMPDLTDGDEGPSDRMKKALGVAGPPVCNIESTQNMRFMKICYSDSSFVMIDRTVKNP